MAWEPDALGCCKRDGACDSEYNNDPLDDGVTAEMLALDVVLLEPPDLERLADGRQRDARDKDGGARPVPVRVRDGVEAREEDERDGAADAEDAGSNVGVAVALAQRARNAAKVTKPALGKQGQDVCKVEMLAGFRSLRRSGTSGAQKTAVTVPRPMKMP